MDQEVAGFLAVHLVDVIHALDIRVLHPVCRRYGLGIHRGYSPIPTAFPPRIDDMHVLYLGRLCREVSETVGKFGMEGIAYEEIRRDREITICCTDAYW